MKDDDLHLRCMIPPHPDLKARMQNELDRIRESVSFPGSLITLGQPDRPGLNDGLIVPGERFPAGTPLRTVRSAALNRAPLRGTVRVVVVMVETHDRRLDPSHGRTHFEQLFFARGAGPSGSVRDFYAEASRGAVDVVGQVVGPYLLPHTMAEYTGGQSGMGTALPNARTMAADAAAAANADVDFGPYDNDGNGFVDAFVVVHAGKGAEETGSPADIWSHKWVLPNGEFNADGTRIYGYLTVPEDARIGVCCHELGHLLFGWPDLYDTDGTSEGLGNWCLMAAGSWNGNGDVPAHPSAWCKAQQGWVEVLNRQSNGVIRVADVKAGGAVHRLWKNGAQGNEYFLVENRRRTLFDRELPGEGLLAYHVDDSVDSNTDERHPKVALLQADGREDLTRGRNRGDAGDAFPGALHRTSLTGSTHPGTRAYNNAPTGVALTEISAPGPVMMARAAVRPAVLAGRPLAAAEGPPPERIHDLVVALYHAVEGAPSTDGGGATEAWRSTVEARLDALEGREAGVGSRQISMSGLSFVTDEAPMP